MSPRNRKAFMAAAPAVVAPAAQRLGFAGFRTAAPDAQGKWRRGEERRGGQDARTGRNEKGDGTLVGRCGQSPQSGDHMSVTHGPVNLVRQGMPRGRCEGHVGLGADYLWDPHVGYRWRCVGIVKLV